MKKDILVLYHKNCSDGFGAAWAAWKKFGNTAEYIPLVPEVLPSAFPKKKKIYSVDLSYPVSVQKKLRRHNISLTVIDHHVSRKEDTEAFPENIFDNDHSGAVLAWQYFHPKKPIPKLLKHIEDIDLWRWNRANTREIISALALHAFDFSVWDTFANALETPKGRKKIISEGTIVSLYEGKIIEKMVGSAVPVEFEGMRILAANSSVLNSEVANALLEKFPPMAIVWRSSGEEVYVSLRSDGTVDVSKIAAKYGGGGHARASGFILKSKGNFPWKTLE